MKKKQYTSPLIEVMPLNAMGGIMKTSIGMDDTNLPTEPGAPERRNWWLF